MYFVQPRHQWSSRQRPSQNQIASAPVKEKPSHFLNDATSAKESAVAAFGRMIGNWPKLQIMLGADLRSLAAFRIGTAIILILNLYVILPDLDMWYGNMGVWPIVDALKLNNRWWSFHLICGDDDWQMFLVAVSFVFHMMMLVGYRTTFSTVMSWVMQASLQSRNVLVLNGGDVYLRMCLFWGMFLPLGEVCSVDAALKKRAPQGQQTSSKYNILYLSLATVAFVLQISIIYWFTAVVKTGAPWREGTAVYYALSLDAFTTPTGYILYQFPTLMKLLTHITLWFEFWGPFFFFMPFYTEVFRAVGVLGFWGMHTGFGMCMEIGLFPWLPIPCTMPLLPPWFWDKLFGFILAKRKANKSAITICVNPSANPIFVSFVKVFYGTLLTEDCKLFTEAPDDGAPNEEWLKQQLHLTDTSMEKVFNDLRNNEFSIGVLDGTGKKHYDESAIVAMLRSSIVCWPFSYLMQLGPFRAMLRVTVKGINVRFLAKSTKDLNNPEPEVPINTSVIKRKRVKGMSWIKAFKLAAKEFLVLICLLIVIDYNVSTYQHAALVAPSLEYPFIHNLRLDQYWGMFSPQPPTEDGWYVIESELADGSIVDLYRDGEPVNWEKPALVSHTFPTEKWRKYMMNLYSENLESQRNGFGRWLCRKWNWYGPGSVDPKKSVVQFKITLMREVTLPDYKTLPVQKVVVWHHQC